MPLYFTPEQLAGSIEAMCSEFSRAHAHYFLVAWSGVCYRKALDSNDDTAIERAQALVELVSAYVDEDAQAKCLLSDGNAWRVN